LKPAGTAVLSLERPARKCTGGDNPWNRHVVMGYNVTCPGGILLGAEVRVRAVPVLPVPSGGGEGRGGGAGDRVYEEEYMTEETKLKDRVRIETILSHAGTCRDDQTGSVSMPVYQTATFRHPSLGESTGFDYSRSGNPTRAALEEVMAEIEGGAKGLAFSSGMAAVDCLFRIFKPGDSVAVTEDSYGGTFRLLEKVFRPAGLDIIFVDTSRIDAVADAMSRSIKAIFVESLTNPMLRVSPISEISRLAREKGVLTIVDNTFLTPCVQQPLVLGADVALYSATKYLSGHNDVLAGILVARTAELGERLYFYQNSAGAVLGPWDSWLTLRGLKTLPLRMERQQKNAGIIAEWLTRHPRVKKVYYPGLKDHPGHGLLRAGSRGFGAIISFEVDDPDLVPAILSGVRVFLFAESLGGVESLITFPAVQTHADVDPETRERLGINNRLLRISAGTEAVEDLIDDLASAMGRQRSI
jgi:cystathionine beta-lyase/cystathionine gamma-synthase